VAGNRRCVRRNRQAAAWCDASTGPHLILSNIAGNVLGLPESC